MTNFKFSRPDFNKVVTAFMVVSTVFHVYSLFEISKFNKILSIGAEVAEMVSEGFEAFSGNLFSEDFLTD